MRVLLATIGTRGDVQPLVALAAALRSLGQAVRLCVPPDFRDWIERMGMPVTSVGPELRPTGKAGLPAAPLSAERRREMMAGAVAAQFETIAEAAHGCDVVVGATIFQIAAPSVAERMGIPYVFAAYCPNVLPSPHHAPPIQGTPGDVAAPAAADNRALWAQAARRWTDICAPLVDSHRASFGLSPVRDLRSHLFTDQPWLAADPTLAPWPDPADRTVFQTGAWILPDDRPLSPDLETFLDAGEPPVYFGFGSTRAPDGLSQVMIRAARALGLRTILSPGWADLPRVDDGPDCLTIGDVNQQALFTRVAAVVHHGGAGTTTAAARAGAPQVIIPQLYDQYYWAQRVHQLGIGSTHASGAPTTASLTSVLARALERDVAARAHAVAPAVRRDGALLAARRLITAYARNAA